MAVSDKNNGTDHGVGISSIPQGQIDKVAEVRRDEANIKLYSVLMQKLYSPTFLAISILGYYSEGTIFLV